MTRIRKLILASSVFPLLVGGAMVIWPRASRRLKRLQTIMVMPVYSTPIARSSNYTNLIFLHHSTGRKLIEEGNVRALLAARGFHFWDHDYNDIGLTAPDGTLTQAHYQIPGGFGGGNTDVAGLAKLFAQPVTMPPDNAFSRLLQHDVIIVKSCFPNSAIKNEAMAKKFKGHYLQIRDEMDSHPDHLFIMLTSPPLHPLATTIEEAKRARDMATWLTSSDFLQGHPNVRVFDYFDLLADPMTNTLRQPYQQTTTSAQSHPNRTANKTIGPLFADFVETAVLAYQK